MRKFTNNFEFAILFNFLIIQYMDIFERRMFQKFQFSSGGWTVD